MVFVICIVENSADRTISATLFGKQLTTLQMGLIMSMVEYRYIGVGAPLVDVINNHQKIIQSSKDKDTERRWSLSPWVSCEGSLLIQINDKFTRLYNRIRKELPDLAPLNPVEAAETNNRCNEYSGFSEVAYSVLARAAGLQKVSSNDMTSGGGQISYIPVHSAFVRTQHSKSPNSHDFGFDYLEYSPQARFANLPPAKLTTSRIIERLSKTGILDITTEHNGADFYFDMPESLNKLSILHKQCEAGERGGIEHMMLEIIKNYLVYTRDFEWEEVDHLEVVSLCYETNSGGMLPDEPYIMLDSLNRLDDEDDLGNAAIVEKQSAILEQANAKNVPIVEQSNYTLMKESLIGEKKDLIMYRPKMFR